MCCHFPLSLFLELVLEKYGVVTTNCCLAWPYITHSPGFSQEIAHSTQCLVLPSLQAECPPPQNLSASRSCLHGPW